MSSLNNKDVAVSFTGLKQYPTQAPFHPPELYPEYPGTETDPSNQIYHWVRETLRNLGLDAENYGTPDWNPLKDTVQPGMTVFIKPNTVRHYHVEGKDLFSVITHGSVVRPVLDYIGIALKGEGRIIVGDSQTLYGHFDEAQELSFITPVLDWFRSQSPIEVEHFDLRKVRAVRTWLGGRWGRVKVEHDPRGYKTVDVGSRSMLDGLDATKFRTVVSDVQVMRDHHGAGKHQYVFPGSVLASDAIIAIPKLKTHRRAAVTLALKSCIGFASDKGTLAHYQVGSPEEGGDEYIHMSWRKRQISHLQDKVQQAGNVPLQFLFATARNLLWYTHYLTPLDDKVNEAMWYGNNTIWRTILDCYQITMFADKEGKLQDTPQRNHFAVVDGIVGGERVGPIAPDPVYPGVLLAGADAVSLDAVGTALMGFDGEKVPLIKNGLDLADKLDPIDGGIRANISVAVEDQRLNLGDFQDKYNLSFAPHPAFKGHIERK